MENQKKITLKKVFDIKANKDWFTIFIDDVQVYECGTWDISEAEMFYNYLSANNGEFPKSEIVKEQMI